MAQILQMKRNEWYQLKISLDNVQPPIWRRFLVSSDIRLPDLHKVIQTVMGWTNSHLHQFLVNGKCYAEPDPDSHDKTIDYRKIKLNQVLSETGKSIKYEYDFGDGWEHLIELESIIKDQVGKYTVCLDGERSCPPEDCGGPFRYEDMLRIINDPKDEAYDEITEWLGDDFDPEYFDIDEINEMLKEKDYGCITLE